MLPTHLQYFTRASIGTLLGRCGYDLLEVTTAPKALTVGYYFDRVSGYSPTAGRMLVSGARAIRFKDRIWAPDFGDRMAVIARPRDGGAAPLPTV